MQYHAERMRRIKELVARLDAARAESHELILQAEALSHEADTLAAEVADRLKRPHQLDRRHRTGGG
jgi:hypothetical protein